jgi:hypothetical protein
MPRKPVSRRTFLALVAGVLVMPIAIAVVLAVSALLAAMRDAAGGMVLRYVALGCGIFWVIALICLVLAQAVNSLSEEPSGEDSLSGDDLRDWKRLRGEQDEHDR